MKTIMIVEDEPDIRKTLAIVLRGQLEDCTVLEAADGVDGLAMLRQIPADLVITDLHMPRLDGFGLIHQAKAVAPRARVYAMSGCLGSAELSRLKCLDVARCFEKPFSYNEMAAAIALDLGLEASGDSRRVLRINAMPCPAA